jgi:hypothetical protein
VNRFLVCVSYGPWLRREATRLMVAPDADAAERTIMRSLGLRTGREFFVIYTCQLGKSYSAEFG